MVNSAREAASLLREDWPALSAAQRTARFRHLPRSEAEDLFRQLDAADQASLPTHLPREERRSWSRALAPDDAADCLQAAPGSMREELLGYLDEPSRREVVALLAYAEDEAGGLMNPRYARMRPEMRVDEALAYLRRQALERVGTLYYADVLDAHQRLIGVISVRELFAASADKKVAEDKVYDGLAEYVDLVAERIVQLGGRADGIGASVVERSSLPPCPSNATDGMDHIRGLSAGLAALGKTARNDVDDLAEWGDAGSADLVTEVSRGIDEHLWLVEAHVHAK